MGAGTRPDCHVGLALSVWSDLTGRDREHAITMLAAFVTQHPYEFLATADEQRINVSGMTTMMRTLPSTATDVPAKLQIIRWRLDAIEGVQDAAVMGVRAIAIKALRDYARELGGK